MSRFLAAIGLGNKAEADVSYPPAVYETAPGGVSGAGGSDLR